MLILSTVSTVDLYLCRQLVVYSGLVLILDYSRVASSSPAEVRGLPSWNHECRKEAQEGIMRVSWLSGRCLFGTYVLLLTLVVLECRRLCSSLRATAVVQYGGRRYRSR